MTGVQTCALPISAASATQTTVIGLSLSNTSQNPIAANVFVTASAVDYYIVQGSCSKCTALETYNNYTQTCSIAPCKGVNEYYSPATQTCVC